MINMIDHDTLNAINSMINDGLLPKTQKELAKVFGVKTSTVNTWISKDKFPDYILKMLHLIAINSDLVEENKKYKYERSCVIPVENNDKILLIKLRSRMTAVFAEELTGDIIAECYDVDNAAEIIDALN